MVSRGQRILRGIIWILFSMLLTLKDLGLTFWCAKALPIPYQFLDWGDIVGIKITRTNVWFLYNCSKLENDQQKNYRNPAAFIRILGLLSVSGLLGYSSILKELSFLSYKDKEARATRIYHLFYLHDFSKFLQK